MGAVREGDAMTRASNDRPTRRVMSSRVGLSKFERTDEYVVELRAETMSIRPKGCRRNGPAEVVVTPGAIYLRALQVRIETERAEKRRARRKGRR